MADRGKKISELQTTTTVANTDRLVILKDPAGTPSTRSLTVNVFAQALTPLVQTPVSETSFVSNSQLFASNGTSDVAWLQYTLPTGRTGMEINFHARDVTTTESSVGTLFVVTNSSAANTSLNITKIGSNPINFDVSPNYNTSSNTVTFYFNRSSAATTNIRLKYSATVF